MAKWIAIKAKIPETLSNADIKQALTKMMDDTAKKDFEQFVEPFRAKNKPSFKTKVTKSGDRWEAFTGVESNWTKGKVANKNDKFMFLARGTDVRYATMSPQFRAKTKRNSLVSSSARGNRDPLYVDTREPRPGIESRNTEEVVRKKRQKEIKNRMADLVGKNTIRRKLLGI